MIRIIYISIVLLSFSFIINAQTNEIDQNQKNLYIHQFEQAKELLSQKHYKQAKNILSQLIQKPDIDIVGCIVKSEISNKLGLTNYYLGNVFNAFKILKEQTLPIRVKCDSINSGLIAQIYYNIGYLYSDFYDFNNALKYINKGLEILEIENILYDKKYVQWFLNQYYNSRKIGDYHSAEGYAFKALSLLDSLGLKNSEISGNVHLRIGRICIDKGEYHLAENHLLISQRIFLNSNSKDIGVLYRNFAILNSALKKYKTSINWSKKAMYYYKSNNINYHLRTAKTLETYGLALSHSGNSQKALSLFLKSLEIRLKINANNYPISNIYENIAGAYGRMSKLDSALFFIDLSIKKLHALDKEKYYGKYEELRKNDFGKRDMVRKLQMKGKFLNAKYKENKDIDNLLKAEISFKEADSLVYLLRRDIKNSDSKIILGTSLDTVYRYAIDNAFSLWETTRDTQHLERAYHYSSENKAVVFSETKEELNAVWEILDSNLRKKYLKISDELKSNLFQKQYAVLKNDTIAYQRLNTEFITLSTEKDSLFSKIQTDYPKFYQNIYGVLKPKSIKELQSKLDDDNAIIEYYIDANRLFSFVITKNDFYVNKQITTFKLDSLFEDYSTELTIFNNKISNLEKSKTIYPILFPESVIDFLNKNNIKRLNVIRDKSLNKVTFAPILTGPDFNKDYLIFKYAFTYAFNNKYIWEINSSKEDKEYSFGGFATNYDQKTLAQIAKDTMYWEKSYSPILKELTQAVNEVNTISQMFKSQEWIGDQASIHNFRQNANKYNILYLSLHSLIASENNEQNAMIFQRTEKDSSFILKSADLISMRLNNDLSVLSSCFTFDGHVISGEGMKSLARNFALSGSPAIVASQWQAYEGQTRDLLQNFFKYLKKGSSKDLAMQKAQVDYITKNNNRFSSPSNWANLVVIGDNKAIEVKNVSVFAKYPFLTFASIFLIVMGLGYLIIRSRKNS